MSLTSVLVWFHIGLVQFRYSGQSRSKCQLNATHKGLFGLVWFGSVLRVSLVGSLMWSASLQSF